MSGYLGGRWEVMQWKHGKGRNQTDVLFLDRRNFFLFSPCAWDLKVWMAMQLSPFLDRRKFFLLSPCAWDLKVSMVMQLSPILRYVDSSMGSLGNLPPSHYDSAARGSKEPHPRAANALYELGKVREQGAHVARTISRRFRYTCSIGLRAWQAYSFSCLTWFLYELGIFTYYFPFWNDVN